MPVFARKRRRPDLVVSEERGVRHLHVGGEAIQSAMRLDDPWALELDYTRCMMAFLLFHPQPRRALMIGLGGGSLAKFFHRRLAGLRTHVVEYDERVIATARALFHVPADDARLSIEHGDGVEALAPECCDLLVVDGYEDEATPAAMVSQAFFDAAWCALEEPGAFVMNFMDDDPNFDRNLQRIERAFGGAVHRLPVAARSEHRRAGPERDAARDRVARTAGARLRARAEVRAAVPALRGAPARHEPLDGGRAARRCAAWSGLR